jgi:hypothetical protein
MGVAMPKIPTSLRLVLRVGRYWIVGSSPWGPVDSGPYTDRGEAEDDLEGIVRFHEYKSEPGFITCDPERAELNAQRIERVHRIEKEQELLTAAPVPIADIGEDLLMD